jgi:histidinol-phosphate/aromatic aminotransferase/cobyric acid decarboxylase-like protein
VKRLSYLIVLAFFGLAIFRIGYNASHPELTDWQHYPVWSVGILLVMAFTACLFLWGWHEDRRRASLTHDERIEEDIRLLTKGKRR